MIFLFPKKRLKNNKFIITKGYIYLKYKMKMNNEHAYIKVFVTFQLSLKV